MKKLYKSVIEHLCREYRKGTLNISKEAKRMGVSRRTIYYWLDKKGLIRGKRDGMKLWGKAKSFVRGLGNGVILRRTPIMGRKSFKRI